MNIPTSAIRFRGPAGWVAFAVLAFSLSGCRQLGAASPSKPIFREQDLPAFVPSHLRSFDCLKASEPPKPPDLQAKAWYDEAMTLKRAIHNEDAWDQAERQIEKAAAHGYWPAVKNRIRRLYGAGRQALIRKAVSAGEPEAVFMLGEIFMNGDGVVADQAMAYAIWQKAAMMGDARAMVALAVVLSTKQNNSIGWDMVNIPVATSMLECAMKKGHGDAAVALHDIVFLPRNPDGTFAKDAGQDAEDAATAKGLAVLQEGVKLGSRAAAGEMVSHFLIQSRNNAKDAAIRARYYKFFESSLDRETPERLPNLDAAVPLPPAPLPDWVDDDDKIAGLWETAIGPRAASKEGDKQ